MIDVITLNHVIGHVDDSVASLNDCFRVLVPRGGSGIPGCDNMQDKVK